MYMGSRGLWFFDSSESFQVLEIYLNATVKNFSNNFQKK